MERLPPSEPWEKEAQYVCMRCNHEWTGVAGPTQCPSCRSIYLSWKNHPLNRSQK